MAAGGQFRAYRASASRIMGRPACGAALGPGIDGGDRLVVGPVSSGPPPVGGRAVGAFHPIGFPHPRIHCVRPSLDVTSNTSQSDRGAYAPAAALAVFRLLLLAALPYEALFRYGDYEHFFNLAQFARESSGGWPCLGHWVEFPPLFPYLSLAIHALTGGPPPLYSYALAFLMTICDAANVILLIRIAAKLSSLPAGLRIGWVYAAFLGLPAFGWWTFEPLAVFWVLLSLGAFVCERPIRAG